jgi:DNA gyrase subunit B
MDDASQISKMPLTQFVRHRPGMFVGGTDETGLHHLLFGLLHEPFAVFDAQCDQLEAILYKDGSARVHRRDAGIAPDQVQAHLTQGHGAAVVANALSTSMQIETAYDGMLYRQLFAAAEAQTPVEAARPLAEGDEGGTFYTFMPDYSIFQNASFDYARIQARAKEIAYTAGMVRILLFDERVYPPNEDLLIVIDGLEELVTELNRGQTPLHDVIRARESVHVQPKGKASFSAEIEFALQFTEGTAVQEVSFVNTHPTPEGGTHLTGLRAALTRHVNAHAQLAGTGRFQREDIVAGFTAAVSVMLPRPSFAGAMKVKLTTPEMNAVVSTLVRQTLRRTLDVFEMQTILERCAAQRARRTSTG